MSTRGKPISKLVKYSLSGLLLLLLAIPIVNITACRSIALDRRQLILAAHRGGAGLAPENTLASMDSGIARKANWLELDIRQTRDGQIIVMHDHTIDRTTNGSGKVEDLSLAEIKSFDADKNWHGKYNGIKVPLLEEVIDLVMRSDVRLIIEIKDPELYPGMVEKLVALIRKEKAEKKVLVFSFNKEAVIAVKKALPEVETGVFTVGYERLSKYQGTGINYICPNWISLLYFPSIVERTHDQHCKILVWTPDAKWMMKYALNKGVDGIITNKPDVFNALFK